MTIIRSICAGILALTLSATATHAQQVLNGGFEMAGGIYTDTAITSVSSTGALDWIQFNNSVRLAATNTSTFGFSNPSNINLTAVCTNAGISSVHSGNWSFWCYGDESWTGEGAYQTIPGVTPGQQWVLNAYEMTPCSDPLTNTLYPTQPLPFGFLQLQFGKLSWPTNPITHVYTTNFNGSTSVTAPAFYSTNNPIDVWVPESVTGTVPAGATTMAVYVMELGFGAGSSGSVLFDDLSVVNLNAPITTNYWNEWIARGNQVCWVSDTNSTWQPQGSVNNGSLSWVNLGQAMQGDGNTDCVFDTSLSNKYYRVLQIQ